MTTAGRNDPCPCGSGKKYKRCCLVREEAARAADRPSPVHEQDNRTVVEILRFARRRFPGLEDAMTHVPGGMDLGGPADAFLAPWVAYHLRMDGRPLVEWYLEERGRRLSVEDLEWLSSQRRAWVSYWEVLDVVAGKGMSVRDMLTGEERFVHEVLGSQGVRKWLVVMARVVDHQGASVFGGLYPHPLPPAEAAKALRAAKRRLGTRARHVPIDRLRAPEAETALIECWVSEAAALARRPPPRLQNTEGDDLLLTTDHFQLQPGAGPEVLARLSRLKGAGDPVRKGGETSLTFCREGNPVHRDWENTIVGTVRVGDDDVRIETNSARRADALRARVEEACAGLLRHTAREHSDPWAMLETMDPAALDEQERELREDEGPELRELMRRYRAKRSRKWLDESVPALDGMTPREAAADPRMRGELELLLKHIEYGEEGAPSEERVDISDLRKELGLDPSGEPSPARRTTKTRKAR